MPYWRQAKSSYKKVFPPWESNIPILGRKISHLGNTKAVQKSKTRYVVQTPARRRIKDHDTASQRPRNGVSGKGNNLPTAYLPAGRNNSLALQRLGVENKCLHILMSVHKSYDTETDGCGTEKHHDVWNIL